MFACAPAAAAADKPTLVRLVWDGGSAVTIDEQQLLPGRAGLHPACVERAR
ncbi:MAG: hypothetical protein R2742_03660 [Micropruina glycogenica]